MVLHVISISTSLAAFLCCGCLLLRQDQQNDAISISTLYGKGAAKTLRAKCWLGVGGLEGGGFRWSVSQYWSNSLLFIAISYHTTYFILTNQVNNQAIIPSTDVIQLTLTLDYRTGCRNVSHYQQPWTKFTRTIKLNLILKWLLGSNLSQLYFILLSQWYWHILNEDMNVAVGLAI